MAVFCYKSFLSVYKLAASLLLQNGLPNDDNMLLRMLTS